MSVSKNTYSAGHSISTRYLRLEKDSTTDIIIIDDIMTPGLIEVHTEIDRQVAWLKIVPGFEFTLLDEAPEGITALDPAYGGWDKMRLFVHTSEVFVVQYSDTVKTTQEAVTGYEMGSSADAIVVKIDRQANTVTLYE